MTNLEIIQKRQQNQHLTGSRFKKPAEIVRWLGAIQAQDYVGAKWALGVRLPGSTDEQVERAFTDGSIFTRACFTADMAFRSSRRYSLDAGPDCAARPRAERSVLS